MDDATRAQVMAADPAQSTWLSANAGSGKTRVLIDRVARLLLAGTEPQRILCLTYTKAAASEMQNRLFTRLGEWAMMPEPQLQAALAALDPAAGPIGPDQIARARRLFARAIETPGGLKIQTIHSFCASILRRFPLEAGVSPRFQEMDDRMGALLRAEIVEDMADTLAPDVIARMAWLFTGEDFGKIAQEVSGSRAGFAPRDAADIARRFGLGPGASFDAVLQDTFLGDEPLFMGLVISAMQGGKKTDVENAAKLAALDFSTPSVALLDGCIDVFLTKTGKAPFTAKVGTLPTKDIGLSLGATRDRLDYLMQRTEGARATLVALKAAERTQALHQFAGVFLPEYERRKLLRGWLDFDDLILNARALLSDPSVAQWVLYRLDGGIDHILVDEAQDTGPAQWQVIELLTQEFTAGAGARDKGRTIFVVGDKKQSIYSFQGADLQKFDEMQAQFAQRLEQVGQPMQGRALLHSFRSAPAILQAVDAVFAGSAQMGDVRHLAFKAALPGRVDLWPPLAPEPAPDDPDWFDPVDLLAPRSAVKVLAEGIAQRINQMLRAGEQIWHKDGVRPLRPGDFLVLVQRRSPLFHEVIRACKAAGLPIAGADRMVLGAELAVRDLTALMSFLATPEDDLSLAAALRSPLLGWSEGQVYDLAANRPPRSYLWAALRAAPGVDDTRALLDDLRDRADYLRPYELIDRVLTRHQGRKRLIARLGPEAEDGIDQVLATAMAYERLEVPSLTGFLTWLASDKVEVKRQADSAGDSIRVMTVHGAKGLEAPVVILPDTGDRTLQDRDLVLDLAPDFAVWRTPAADSPAEITQALEQAKVAREAENDRLLYVAMTRAESWLIVAAAADTKKPENWFNRISAGLDSIGTTVIETPTGPGRRLQSGDWPAPVVAAPEAQRARAVQALPDWATHPAPPPPARAKLWSPSALGGAKALPGEGQDSETALARGSALHRLLEHLPRHPPEDWPHLAPLIAGDMAAELLPEAMSVLRAPALAPLFAPGTFPEVPFAATVAGHAVAGTVDRLIIEPGRVLVVDFKSNLALPDRPDQVPEGLLRQMGAYRAAMGAAFPDTQVDCAILWTRAATLMHLPAALVDAALARAEWS